MPYERKGKCVYNKETGKKKGCSSSVAKAKAYLKALYASEPEAVNEGLSQAVKDRAQDIYSAIKADKLDETTTATGVATSAISASSFLSKVKEAAEVQQQKEGRRGEEMEGAVPTKPTEGATTEEQQTKGPLKAPPSDDDLKRARQLAMEKALKEKQEKEKEQAKIKEVKVGIGSTGAPGFFSGLIKTGMKQEDIEGTERIVTEITPQNQKELFDSFFDILKSLAKIGAVVDLYAIVFNNSSIRIPIDSSSNTAMMSSLILTKSSLSSIKA